MADTNALTQERLKELLNYDASTGVFTRKVSTNGAKAGDIAGRKTKGRYVEIRVDGGRYLAHRLAWLYMYGEFPSDDIDHINHIKTDNSLANLRVASKAENQKNRSLSIRNKTGVSGVCPHNSGWYVRVGKSDYLGLYKDFFEAVCVRKSAENAHNYHINHGV